MDQRRRHGFSFSGGQRTAEETPRTRTRERDLQNIRGISRVRINCEGAGWRRGNAAIRFISVGAFPLVVSRGWRREKRRRNTKHEARNSSRGDVLAPRDRIFVPPPRSRQTTTVFFWGDEKLKRWRKVEGRLPLPNRRSLDRRLYRSRLPALLSSSCLQLGARVARPFFQLPFESSRVESISRRRVGQGRVVFRRTRF